MTASSDGGSPPGSGPKRLVLPDLKRFWILAGGAGILLWFLALALWAQGNWDERVLFLFDPARVAGTPLVTACQWLTGYGMSSVMGLCVVYYLIQLRQSDWSVPNTLYLYVLFSFAISGILGDLLKMVFARPRPVAVFAEQILALSDAASPAFPSGHATKAVALALPILLFVPTRPTAPGLWKVFVALIALGVGFSRIVLGAHYLSDVLAGFGMALFGLPISMFLAHIILRRVSEEQLPGAARKWVTILAVLAVGILVL